MTDKPISHSCFEKLSIIDLHLLAQVINVTHSKSLKEWFMENLSDEDSIKLKTNPFVLSPIKIVPKEEFDEEFPSDGKS
jgi:hypothetical protein